MILVDSAVWVDHLRSGDATLSRLLDAGRVLSHPFVVCELALGNLRQRHIVLSALQDLPQAAVASDEEVLGFVHRNTLFCRGIGYVDAHLLASVSLSPDATLWTRDKRLNAVADRLTLASAIDP